MQLRKGRGRYQGSSNRSGPLWRAAASSSSAEWQYEMNTSYPKPTPPSCQWMLCGAPLSRIRPGVEPSQARYPSVHRPRAPSGIGRTAVPAGRFRCVHGRGSWLSGNRSPVQSQSHLSTAPHHLLKSLGCIEPLLAGEPEVDGPLLATDRLELVPVVFQHALLDLWPRGVLLRTRR